jgi:hypothetical protein
MPTPSTVHETIERLIVILSDSEKLTLANTPEQDLIDYTFRWDSLFGMDLNFTCRTAA